MGAFLQYKEEALFGLPRSFTVARTQEMKKMNKKGADLTVRA
jgi:hypothetical protein